MDQFANRKGVSLRNSASGLATFAVYFYLKSYRKGRKGLRKERKVNRPNLGETCVVPVKS